MRVFSFFMVIYVMLGTSLSGQTGIGSAPAGMQFSDFRMRGIDEEEELTWELRGGEAVLHGSTVAITDLQLRMSRPGRPAVDVSSPDCIFNRITNVGRSPSRIEAEGENLYIEGQGYHFLLNKQKMHLHSRVRMIIEHGEQSVFPRPFEERQNDDSSADNY